MQLPGRRACLRAHVIVAALVALPSLANAEQQPPPSRPAIAVLIVFDQLRADYLERWRDLFVEGGFRRLMHHGAYFTNCHCPYASTVTASGHASILTGCAPRRHGIIGNSWYDRSAHRDVGAVFAAGFDPRTDDHPRSPAPSARALLAPTLVQSLKTASAGRAKAIGISLKDRSALLAVGPAADATYWFDGKTGNFTNSTPSRLPGWVNDFNSRRLPDAQIGKTWTRLAPQRDYVKHAGADDVAAEGIGFGQGRTFPHPFPSELGAGYYSAIFNSPIGNDLLFQFAMAAIEHENLGRQAQTDLLSISFSSNDAIGHCWGPDSQEVLDVTLRSDLMLRDLLDYLDKSIGTDRYVLALTADHGVCPIPELLQTQGMDAGRLDPERLQPLAESFLARRFGPLRGRYIEACDFPSIYLNREATRAAGFDLKTIAKSLAGWLPGQPGIARAYAADRIPQLELSSDAIDRRVYQSFYPERSGDVIIVQKLRYIDTGLISKNKANHGSPYAYDTHVPLLILGPRIEAGHFDESTAPAAVAAIFAAVVGIPRPALADQPIPHSLQARLALPK